MVQGQEARKTGRKIETVHPWRKLWRRWSVWLSGIGGGLLATFAMIDPQTLANLWATLPPDIRAALPDWVPKAMGVLMLISGIIATNIKQKSLSDER